MSTPHPKKASHAPSDAVPQEAKQLYGIGVKTEEEVKRMFKKEQLALALDDEISATLTPSDFEFLSKALVNPKWSDDEAAFLIRGIAERQSRETLDYPLIGRWVLAHYNDAKAVLTCVDTLPPPEIEILNRMPMTGSQKLVFRASWRLTQREVVLKMPLLPGVAERDLQSFPLNLSHRNIIETHPMQNTRRELFLVEELLTEVLNDLTPRIPVGGAANLLYDIGAAIKFLHDHNLVHGDIKPDNIGRRQGDYILLDFGICRAIDQFTREATATGSLRTRAPELLLTDIYVDPPKVDVWALGATVFKSVVGRFPLFGEAEEVPRISDPERRAAFEVKLAKRVSDEWDHWVDLSLVDAELRPVLKGMLAKEPSERMTSKDLLDAVESSLPAFVRGADEKSKRDWQFSPVQEIEQIIEHLNSIPTGAPIPKHWRTEIRERLTELGATHGLPEHQRRLAERLSAQLSA